MTAVTRSSAMDDADPWAVGGSPLPEPVAEPDDGLTGAEREAQRLHFRALASDHTDTAVAKIADGLTMLDGNLAGWADNQLDSLDYTGPAELIAWLQQAKARLGVAEAYLARELGRTMGCPDVIVLPDGRHAEVVKGKDRKAWDHDGWKGDVRAALVREVTNGDANGDADVILNAATGEPVDLHALVSKAQAVHGSAAPKVTALKPLGLSADDYCESFPGPYAVKVSTPSDSTPTVKG